MTSEKLQQEAGKSHGRGQPKLEEKIPQAIRADQTRDEAAKLVGVNPRYVSDAKKIKETAPDVFEKMQAGEVDVDMSRAKAEVRTRAKMAERQEKAKQAEAVIQSGSPELIAAAREALVPDS